MAWLFPWLLLLHVLGAIIAFGPTFAFSTIGAMGRKEPQHANFAVRVSATITDRLVIPLAIIQGVTGVGLILVGGIDLFGTRWLLLAIALYAITLTFALAIQRRTVRRVIELTSAPPPPGASGPPPELPPLLRNVRRGGMFTGVMVIAIVLLMVLKPPF